MIREIVGDILLTRAEAIAHGCNTSGRMGAGLAKSLKNACQAMYKDYRYKCLSGDFKPSDAYAYRMKGKYIINLGSQADLGGHRYDYLEGSLQKMVPIIEELNIRSVALPIIGSGLGDLDQIKCKDLIYKYCGPLDISIFLYSEHIEGLFGE